MQLTCRVLPTWWLAGLAPVQAHTRQPVMWLREVLDGIAEQARRGPHKDQYELKKEFRVGRHAAATEMQE